MLLRTENLRMVVKLAVVVTGMFAFGYALIPLYRAICDATGINILSLSERQVPGNGTAGVAARSAMRTTHVELIPVLTADLYA